MILPILLRYQMIFLTVKNLKNFKFIKLKKYKMNNNKIMIISNKIKLKLMNNNKKIMN